MKTVSKITRLILASTMLIQPLALPTYSYAQTASQNQSQDESLHAKFKAELQTLKNQFFDVQATDYGPMLAYLTGEKKKSLFSEHNQFVIETLENRFGTILASIDDADRQLRQHASACQNEAFDKVWQQRAEAVLKAAEFVSRTSEELDGLFRYEMENWDYWTNTYEGQFQLLTRDLPEPYEVTGESAKDKKTETLIWESFANATAVAMHKSAETYNDIAILIEADQIAFQSFFIGMTYLMVSGIIPPITYDPVACDDDPDGYCPIDYRVKAKELSEKVSALLKNSRKTIGRNLEWELVNNLNSGEASFASLIRGITDGFELRRTWPVLQQMRKMTPNQRQRVLNYLEKMDQAARSARKALSYGAQPEDPTEYAKAVLDEIRSSVLSADKNARAEVRALRALSRLLKPGEDFTDLNERIRGAIEGIEKDAGTSAFDLPEGQLLSSLKKYNQDQEWAQIQLEAEQKAQREAALDNIDKTIAERDQQRIAQEAEQKAAREAAFKHIDEIAAQRRKEKAEAEARHQAKMDALWKRFDETAAERRKELAEAAKAKADKDAFINEKRDTSDIAEDLNISEAEFRKRYEQARSDEARSILDEIPGEDPNISDITPQDRDIEQDEYRERVNKARSKDVRDVLDEAPGGDLETSDAALDLDELKKQLTDAGDEEALALYAAYEEKFNEQLKNAAQLFDDKLTQINASYVANSKKFTTIEPEDQVFDAGGGQCKISDEVAVYSPTSANFQSIITACTGTYVYESQSPEAFKQQGFEQDFEFYNAGNGENINLPDNENISISLCSNGYGGDFIRDENDRIIAFSWSAVVGAAMAAGEQGKAIFSEKDSQEAEIGFEQLLNDFANFGLSFDGGGQNIGNDGLPAAPTIDDGPTFAPPMLNDFQPDQTIGNGGGNNFGGGGQTIGRR